MPRIENCKTETPSFVKNDVPKLKMPFALPLFYENSSASSLESLKGRVEIKKLDLNEIFKITGREPDVKGALGIVAGLTLGSYLSKDIRLGVATELKMQLCTLFFFALPIAILHNQFERPMIPYMNTLSDVKERYLCAQAKQTGCTASSSTFNIINRSFLSPLLEEVAFRWIIQDLVLPAIINGLGITPPSCTSAIAIGLTATAFGAVHLLNGKGSELQALSAANSGITLGRLYSEAGLSGTVAAHSIHNTIVELLEIGDEVSRGVILNSMLNGLMDNLSIEEKSIKRIAANSNKDHVTSLCIAKDALIANTRNGNLTDSKEKMSMEVREQNLLNLGRSIVPHPDLFLSLLMLIVFNKGFLQEEKQKLLYKILDLLPKDPELRSLVKNLLYVKIYKAIKDDVRVYVMDKPFFEPEKYISPLARQIESHILINSGLKKEEIEEIAKIVLFPSD